MNTLEPPCRPARPDDAWALAELVNIAGEGLALHVWSGMAGPGESAWATGRSRAVRDSGGFSYRNAIVLEENGKVVACLIGYPLENAPGTINYDEIPAMFVPLQQLEDEVPGTWYVNVLATYPDSRGKGYGGRLLAIAEQKALDANCYGLSVIVSDANTAARRLYEKQGYSEHAQRPMVKQGWRNDGVNWILLVKNIK
jgi:ribosomal protein S18 acetylase RimI-like enzyme